LFSPSYGKSIFTLRVWLDDVAKRAIQFPNSLCTITDIPYHTTHTTGWLLHEVEPLSIAVSLILIGWNSGSRTWLCAMFKKGVRLRTAT
jgi:hypothetical protein